MKTVSVITVVGAAVLLAVACNKPNEYGEAASESKQAATPVNEQDVRYADANRDGKVTRDESRVYAALEDNFDRFDADKNGELDSGEFARLETEAVDRKPVFTRQDESSSSRPRQEYSHPN